MLRGLFVCRFRVFVRLRLLFWVADRNALTEESEKTLIKCCYGYCNGHKLRLYCFPVVKKAAGCWCRDGRTALMTSLNIKQQIVRVKSSKGHRLLDVRAGSIRSLHYPVIVGFAPAISHVHAETVLRHIFRCRSRSVVRLSRFPFWLLGKWAGGDVPQGE